MSKMRIQKFISQTGALSRRAAERAILDGRIKVNGKTLRQMGEQIDDQNDEVFLDDSLLKNNPTKTTFAFYKPRNVLCTRSDPHDRRKIMDYFKKYPGHYPIGRLDYHSEGLILVTNHGEFANYIAHPRFQILKLYEVDLDKALSESELKHLTSGLELEDGLGKFESVVKIIKPQRFTYQIGIREGKNRFIRRMFEKIEYSVKRLKRTQIGSLTLKGLTPGEFVQIDESEVTASWKEYEQKRPH